MTALERARAPIRVTALDVAAQLPSPEDPSDARAMRLLVRSGRIPVAWVTVPSSSDAFDGEQLARAVLEQGSEQVRVGALLRRLSPAATRGAPAPPFTVVVCTRDRTDSLAHCLASLRDVEYDALEIIVVDNAPTSDRTAELVASMSAELRAPRTLRYVREDRPGLDWARNRGIAEAAHELIAFTDDDVRVDAGWLAALATAFADPSVMMVTGFVAPAELDTEAQIEFEDGYGGMGKGFVPQRRQRDTLTDAELLGAHHLGVGANMAFRRDLLRRVGSFDTALDVGTPSHGAGDLEMFHRVLVSGAVAHYEPSAIVWHSHRRDRAGLARQLRDNGRAFGVYLIGCAIRRTVPVMRVARYASIIWLGWLVGRLARSLVGRDPLPATLRAAELWGAMQAPWAYWRTRSSDRALRRGLQNA
jgi:glycosyltransferase involved in cell wall biosynthesis